MASTGELDVLRAARLRARLGLKGQGSDSATAYGDKVIMKRRARRAGLPGPEFAAVDDPMDLLDFIDAQGFPVVVKPRLGWAPAASAKGSLYGAFRAKPRLLLTPESVGQAAGMCRRLRTLAG